MPSPTSSPPHLLETLEVVCSCTVTLAHQKTQGGAWEVGKEITAPSALPHTLLCSSKACLSPMAQVR